MSVFKKLAGQTAIYGLPTIVGKFLIYLLVPLHTKIFSPEDYGVQTEFFSYTSFLMILFTYGMETAFFRFMNREGEPHEKLYSTVQRSIIFSGLAMAGMISLLAQPLASWTGQEGREHFFHVIAWILFTDAIVAIPFARLRQEQKAFQYALLRFSNIFLNFCLNLLLLYFLPKWKLADPVWWNWFDPSLGVFYIFLANLLANCFTVLLLLPKILDIRKGFDRGLWRELLSYGLPLIGVGLAGMVNETFDRTIIRYLVPGDAGEYQLGIYSACYKLSMLMTLFVQAYSFAAEPFFFNLAKQNNDSKGTYARLMRYFVAFCSLIFLLVMLNIGWIKDFIYKDYWGGLAVVPILLLANLFRGVFYNLSVWYKLTNQTGKGAGIAIFGALTTLLLNFILIPVMGYMGAAWTTLVCYASMMILSYLQGQKYYPVHYQPLRLLAYIAGALLVWQIAEAFIPGLGLSGLVLRNMLLLAYAALLVIAERRPKIVTSQSLN